MLLRLHQSNQVSHALYDSCLEVPSAGEIELDTTQVVENATRILQRAGGTSNTGRPSSSARDAPAAKSASLS